MPVKLNRVYFFLICIASLFLLVGCGADEEITIGAVLIETTQDGTPLPIYADLKNGMETAIETINADGGINGRKLRLIPTDCKGDTEEAKRIFQELSKQSPVVIISMYSHISKALTQLAAEKNLPQIAILATAENVIQDAPYTYRYWPWASYEGQAVLPIVKKLRVRKLGLVNIDNSYGNSVSNELSRLLGEEELDSATVRYKDLDQKFLDELHTLQDTDAIYFTCFPDQLVALTTTLRETFPDKPLIGPNSISSPEYSAQAVFEGIYVTAPLIYSPSYPFAVDVSAAYKARTGRQLDHYSAIGYDTINLIKELMRKGKATPEEIKANLDEGFLYPGLFGDVVKEPGIHEFAFPLYPGRIVDGVLVYQER